jgi:hypothetical protein
MRFLLVPFVGSALNVKFEHCSCGASKKKRLLDKENDKIKAISEVGFYTSVEK